MFDVIPKALLDAGGWVFAAVVLAAVIVSMIRGDLVTGRSAREAIDRETKRADKATEQLERNSDIGERLVAANESLHGQIGILVGLLGAWLRKSDA